MPALKLKRRPIFKAPLRGASTEPHRLEPSARCEIHRSGQLFPALERSEFLECNESLDEYPRRCEENIREWEGLRERLSNSAAPLEIKRSVEYGSAIIHSLETGVPRVVYGNVPNAELIANLPAGCCVEMPCLVDKNGIQPIPMGVIPSHLAFLGMSQTLQLKP
jgi:alpha-galactosidase/6-phospho-beta-glucosidase family protein